MKVLENKETKIRHIDTEGTDHGFLKYGTHIINAISGAPQGGFDLKEMKRRLRIITAIEKTIEEKSDFIFFEDGDASHLNKIIRECRFAFAHKDIDQMGEDISKMPSKEDWEKEQSKTQE